MENEGFRVDSPEKAAVVMRKYRKLAQRKQQNERLAQMEQERIERWLTGANASVEAQLEYLEGHLTAWAMAERANGTKSVTLPDGNIKTKAVTGAYEVDKSVFLEWAQESKRDDLLRVTYSPDMTAIKSNVVADGGKAVDALTGEVVPGLQPTPDRVNVTIVPDLEAIDLEGFDDEGDEDVA